MDPKRRHTLDDLSSFLLLAALPAAGFDLRSATATCKKHTRDRLVEITAK